MLIRCEKCNTLYELDDHRIPPQGAPVQCSKCQFVFKAYPKGHRMGAAAARLAGEEKERPEAAGGQAPAEESPQPGSGASPRGGAAEDASPAKEPAARATAAAASIEAERGEERVVAPTAPTREAPTAPAPAVVEPLAPRQVEGAGRSAEGAARGGAGRARPAAAVPSAGEPQFTADGRPIRKVPLPVEEPGPVIPRQPAAQPRMAARGRPSGQRVPMVWLVPLVVVVVVFLAVAAWRMFSPRSPESTPAPQGAGQVAPPRSEGAAPDGTEGPGGPGTQGAPARKAPRGEPRPAADQ